MPRIRRASGVREQDLLARAKTLRGSIDGLLPRRTEECPPERFDKLREELEEVRSARDDDKRLQRLTHWGDPLARSLAGVLKFYLDPGSPVVVAFPTAGGEVSYASLARAPRESEVAVQQGDDPDRLLLGYVEWSRRGFHFFATRRTLYATGRSPRPPPEYLTERIAELPYRLFEDPVHHRFDCVHLKDREPRPYLEVAVPGADRVFRACRKCAKDERHLLGALSGGAAVPDPSAEFPVSAHLNVDCRGGPDCVHADLPELSKALRRGYELGRLSDAKLLDAYLDEAKARIERTNRPTFVAGGVCYGSQLAAFLDALHPSPIERRALEKVLEGTGGYFEVDEPSASRALERLWPHHAEEIVRTIVPDPKEAHRLIEDARGAPGRVAEILKRLEQRSQERELLEQLPRYRSLSTEAAWVDRIAREFRTHGPTGAERSIVQSLPREGKERGLAFGFLVALDRGGAHAWQFSPTEQEFGTALAPPIRALLNVPAAGYHAALDRLLHAAGVADWGVRES
ncbi:MAG TPA: hypothetical protein VMG99_02165 [Thermoplasmata archaeon]|jgi:hypothetical protein|nr:hypothetical protein [Thermoplasmata archaeon]